MIIKSKFFFIIILFGIFGWAENSQAEIKTIPVVDSSGQPSCEQVDVQRTINDKASDGDTVMVPAGECEWASDVTISKNITLQGAGQGLTIIYNTQDSRYDGVLEVTSHCRITGFTFSGKVGTGTQKRIIDVAGAFSDFRIDNCTFTGGRNITNTNWETAVAIYVSQAYGLIDNCTFTNAAGEVIQATGRSDSWSMDSTIGLRDVVYVEDCTFVFDAHGTPTGYVGAAHAIMGEGAGRYVFRYNTITHYNVDAHGYCGSTVGGTRHYEIYENTFNILASKNQSNIAYIRGGTGVIFNNTVTNSGTLSSHISLTEHRIDRASCQNGCCCSYPCEDQIGRGKDQFLDPLYVWGNIVNGGPAAVGISDYANPGDCEGICGKTQGVTDYIQNNRDYFLFEKPGYVPYTYPHPLRNENPTDTIPPANPSGLSVK